MPIIYGREYYAYSKTYVDAAVIPYSTGSNNNFYFTLILGTVIVLKFVNPVRPVRRGTTLKIHDIDIFARTLQKFTGSFSKISPYNSQKPFWCIRVELDFVIRASQENTVAQFTTEPWSVQSICGLLQYDFYSAGHRGPVLGIQLSYNGSLQNI